MLVYFIFHQFIKAIQVNVHIQVVFVDQFLENLGDFDSTELGAHEHEEIFSDLIVLEVEVELTAQDLARKLAVGFVVGVELLQREAGPVLAVGPEVVLTDHFVCHRMQFVHQV